MIKINGLNYYQGSGDRYLFGHFDGGGSGKGIPISFSNSSGSGSGDGYYFGFKLFGGGDSYGSKLLKEEFQKNDKNKWIKL